jgi:hypothetical protein
MGETMRLQIGLVALVAATILAWFLWPRHPPTDEELIRADIADMATHAEKKELGSLMEHISDRYSGEGGSKDELRAELAGYLFGAEGVAVVVRHLEVEVDHDQAHVKMVVLLLRGKAGEGEAIRPELIVGSHRIEADFVREKSWRVLRASRKEVSPAELLP